MFTTATDRQILKIALPLIFSNLSVPLVGFVDNAVLGHLSSPVYLASAGLGAIIMSYVLFSFGFIKSTTTGFISQIDHMDHLKSVRSIYQVFIPQCKEMLVNSMKHIEVYLQLMSMELEELSNG